VRVSGSARLAEASRWLEGLIDAERTDVPYARLGLEPIQALLDALGHPERGLSILLVGGSKGKGSTALLAEAILRESGERVGVFTKPHLERWTERFRVDGAETPGEALAAALDALRPHVERLRAGPPGPAPSWFDVTVAAALLVFRAARVDRVILEVGLGGRLDSTNAVAPDVTCLTTVELEHTDKLGSTLAAIAGEKAGILRPGVPLVTGRLPDEAEAVVAARVRELGLPWTRLGADLDVEVVDAGLEGTRLRVHDGSFALDATLPLLGVHQAPNAALALACVRRLPGRAADAALAPAARRAFAGVRLPGRVELVGRRPWLVVDAAHTAASARALAAALAPIPRARTHLVLSVSAGKDLAAILAALLPLAHSVTATRAEAARSLDPAALAAAVAAAAPGVALRCVPNPHLALRAAREALGPDDLLVATGSVYLAGIARAVLAGEPAEVAVSRRAAVPAPDPPPDRRT
jgi:dihydrofolate synthase/folylpolyglutamate synthase